MRFISGWLRGLFLVLTVYLGGLYLSRKLLPDRLDPKQAPNAPFGFTQAYGLGREVNEQGVDVIFVHGLGSNPDTTWSLPHSDSLRLQPDTEGKDRVCWITDFLPEDLSAVVRNDTRFFFYNHDTYWQRNSPQSRLKTLGATLLGKIDSGILGTKNEQNRLLVFIGFSYGGLIIKEALVQAYYQRSGESDGTLSVVDRTKGLIFLGTPHRGSKLSWLGSLIAWGLSPTESNRELVKELSYDNPALNDMHGQFLTASRSIKVINFYEERRYPLFGFYHIWIAEEQSASFHGNLVENFPLPLDHFALVKYREKDANYEFIKNKLNQVLLSIPQIKARQFFSVPLETVYTFAERPKVSAEISQKLDITHANSSVPHALTLHGLGGTGKTQLALKYIDDHKEHYETIFWINAQNEESVHQSFHEFAMVTGLQLGNDPIKNPSLLVHAVREWLRARQNPKQRWLVIIDGADDVGWGLKKIMPRGTQGSILITSQDSQSKYLVNGECEEVVIGILGIEEASSLTLKNLGLYNANVSDEILGGIDTLNKDQLGLLAIAVELAGAYIRNGPEDKYQAIQDFMQKFDHHREKLLQNPAYLDHSFTDKTVWTVWEITLSKLDYGKTGILPSMMLSFLAQFQSPIIKDSLIRQYSEFENGKLQALNKEVNDPTAQSCASMIQLFSIKDQIWDTFYYEEAIAPLLRYHLLQRINSGHPAVTMHSLVKLRAMHLGHRLESLADRASFGAFCSIFSRGEPWDIEQAESIIEHLPDFDAEFLDNQGSPDYEKFWIWLQLGEANRNLGKHKESAKMFERAIQLSHQMQGLYHEDTLGTMWRWYKVLASEGRRNEMIEVLEFLLGAYTMTRGVGPLEMILIKSELAVAYWQRRRHREAMMLQTETVSQLKLLLGMEHCRTHSAMSLWGQMWAGEMWAGEDRLEDVATLRLDLDDGKDRTELFELWAVATIKKAAVIKI